MIGLKNRPEIQKTYLPLYSTNHSFCLFRTDKLNWKSFVINLQLFNFTCKFEYKSPNRFIVAIGSTKNGRFVLIEMVDAHGTTSN